jgi:glycosyltransferase involved in cell wall biosynthesis
MTRNFPRAVILNNEIIPYRVPLFRALHGRPDLEVRVLLSTTRSRERKWTVDPAGLPFPHEILPGVCLSLPKRKFSEKRSIYFNPTLLPRLVQLRPDVVVAYEFSIPSMTALLYARLARRPLLIWSECTTVSDRFLTAGQRWTRSVIIPRVQGFFGTSASACRNLEALGAAPDRVLEAPQVHQVGWIAQETARIRGTPDGAGETILFVGSLIERKGIRLLLEAFARVGARRPAARLRIVGEGPLRRRLEREAARLGIAGRVDFAGFVEPTQIPAQYAEAGLFVLPTLEDTFAVVIVEAMAAGVPVICSPFAGVSTYLRDGEDAFVADPNDTELLAARIDRLLEDRGLRARFSARGREISKTFEADSVAEIFAKGIRDAAARGMA